MNVDQDIFVSRPEELEGRSLLEALQRAAKRATQITIISAYYSVDGVMRLFENMTTERKRVCHLRIILGIDRNVHLANDIDAIRKLQRLLRQSGFSNLQVSLYLPNSGAPLHTKLYKMVNRTHPTWFVGSANISGAISGDRHEMMLRLSGAHAKMSKYVEHLVEQSVPAESKIPTDPAMRDLRSFFLSGDIAYRSTYILPMAYEACLLTAAQKRHLNDLIGEGLEVPFAGRNDSTGLSFSLTQAANQAPELDNVLSGTGDSRQNENFRYKHYAVQTSLGFWLPRPYADVTKQLYQDHINQVDLQLASLADRLEHTLFDKYLEQHIRAIEQIFQEKSAEIRDVRIRQNWESHFKSFLQSRINRLRNPDERLRLATDFHITRLPDFWGDSDAVRVFTESFMNEVAYQTSKSGNRSWIAQVICQELWGSRERPDGDAYDAEDLEGLFSERLKNKLWVSKNWPLRPDGNQSA